MKRIPTVQYGESQDLPLVFPIRRNIIFDGDFAGSDLVVMAIIRWQALDISMNSLYSSLLTQEGGWN